VRILYTKGGRRRTWIGVLPIAGVLVLSLGAAAQEPAPGFDPAAFRPFFRAHCADCHLDGASKGGLAIDVLPADLRDAETLRRWTLLFDRVRTGEMPPPKKAELPAAARDGFLRSLEVPLERADRARRRVVLRRLNRIEYENTVRDLFGIHVDVRDLLPEDASLHGFDTVGEALAASSELVQGYLEAADAVLDAAYGPVREPKPLKLRFPLSKDLKSEIGNLFRETPDGVAMFNSGYCPSVIRSFRPQAAGTYRVRIQAKAFQSERPVTMSVHAGDVLVHRRPQHLVGYYDLPPDRWTVVEFVDRFEPGDMVHPKPYGTPGSVREKHLHPGPGIVIGEIEAEGPLEPWPPPSRAALWGGADPKSGTLEDARSTLARLLPRAFRRPPAPGAVEPFLALVKAQLDAGRPYADALRVGLKGVLTSPSFLFRREPAGADGSVDDFALASRLSYAFWSSMPDDELLAVAARGGLKDPATLRAQTERLLSHPKAAAFTRNFTGQWLDLRLIDFTEPDRRLHPEFDELLKVSMVAETERFFEEILKGDRSLLEFVDADWTMLNARLARHYGVEGVTGQELRRVQLPPGSPRGGVLTQGAVLKVTANGTNTSPVIRGVWVLENILGRPVGPPPPGVPAVEPDIRGTTTLRQQLDRHRDVPSCAGCHSKIDPPGFALESFDVVGGWRDWYRSLGAGERVERFVDAHANVRVQYRKGPPVDAKGTTASGQAFDGIRDFKRILLAEPDAIVRCLAGKLLTYALGRGTGFSDRAEVARIAAAAKEKNWGFRTLVHSMVESGVFRAP
jgi:hypothetical protein